MFRLISILLLLVSGLVSACDVLDEPTVLRYIADGRKVAVFLGASWCPHCRREKPLYESACDKYRASHAGSDIILGSIECGSSGCPGFHVSGVPDIRYYNSPTVFTSYSGPDYDHWLDDLK